MIPNGNLDILYVADLDVSLREGTSLQSFDGYIWTGSNLTLYHDVPEVTRQIELSRAIYEAGIPQFGSCWGVQMAAMAAGGEFWGTQYHPEFTLYEMARLLIA